MSQVLFFAVASAFNPTLLGATTVMLLLPNPKRLLLGYLLGATATSISLGLLIVFKFEDSSAVDATQNTLSPVADIVLGVLLLAIAYAIRSGRHERRAERRRAKKAGEPAKIPSWQRFLNRGSARDTFVVGALLTLPGASYLAGLSHISKLDLNTVETVLSVVGFNLIMLALLEVPLIGYTLAPEWTPRAVQGLKESLSRNGARIAYVGSGVLGTALVLRGAIQLLV